MRKFDYEIAFNRDCVETFLSWHPEFLASDLIYCPDVFREMVEETEYDENINVEVILEVLYL